MKLADAWQFPYAAAEVEHEARMLTYLAQLAKRGIVPALVEYGSGLGGATLHIATELIDGCHPQDPVSRCGDYHA